MPTQHSGLPMGVGGEKNSEEIGGGVEKICSHQVPMIHKVRWWLLFPAYRSQRPYYWGFGLDSRCYCRWSRGRRENACIIMRLFAVYLHRRLGDKGFGEKAVQPHLSHPHMRDVV